MWEAIVEVWRTYSYPSICCVPPHIINFEKTKDGNLFDQVAVVKDAGTSSQTIIYSTVDLKPYGGISYYRLKQTDFDGNSQNSNLVPIKYFKSSTDLYPNPLVSARELTLTYTSNVADKINFTLKDVLGHAIYSSILETKQGLNSFSVSIPELSNGIYFVELKSTEKEEAIKFICKYKNL